MPTRSHPEPITTWLRIPTRGIGRLILAAASCKRLLTARHNGWALRGGAGRGLIGRAGEDAVHAAMIDQRSHLTQVSGSTSQLLGVPLIGELDNSAYYVDDSDGSPVARWRPGHEGAGGRGTRCRREGRGRGRRDQAGPDAPTTRPAPRPGRPRPGVLPRAVCGPSPWRPNGHPPRAGSSSLFSMCRVVAVWLLLHVWLLLQWGRASPRRGRAGVPPTTVTRAACSCRIRRALLQGAGVGPTARPPDAHPRRPRTLRSAPSGLRRRRGNDGSGRYRIVPIGSG